jgi:hypothetical protein
VARAQERAPQRSIRQRRSRGGSRLVAVRRMRTTEFPCGGVLHNVCMYGKWLRRLPTVELYTVYRLSDTVHACAEGPCVLYLHNMRCPHAPP